MIKPSNRSNLTSPPDDERMNPSSSQMASSLPESKPNEFPSLNQGYNAVFRSKRLSLGLVLPLENHGSVPIPKMHRHVERVQLAERLGFSAVWTRDVPFNDPTFGDAGQVFDPFVYLGLLAGQTERIALGVASVVLPLRHPVHVAKSAASVDVLSGGRLILGVASGDRPQEYPAMNLDFENRGARFRESFEYLRCMGKRGAAFSNSFGRAVDGLDLLPKPVGGKLPLMITGASQQSRDWLTRNGDGWMVYPRDLETQRQSIEDWRMQLQAAGRPNLPIMQPLYIDLTDDPNTRPLPIHLGFRLGLRSLKKYIGAVQEIGVNHLALNLRFNRADLEATLNKLGEEVLPAFADYS